MTAGPESLPRKLLVANRGEIAVRVIRAARDHGIASVAVYADGDRDAPHVHLADEAYPLEGATAAGTYLNAARLIAIASRSGADAVHPGYGFLSEDAGFAQAVLDAGLIWVGPPPEAIRLLGDKVSARAIAAGVGAPLVAGTADPVGSAEQVAQFAREHGLPVAIKAAHGGGGRGLKVARSMEEIPEQFDSAVREAELAFGRGACFVERYLDRARHVEAQVLADQHGNVAVVGTRDCTLQRRHQKLVEEAPAPFLGGAQREQIQHSAEAICRAAGYAGAGTVEYLLSAEGELSFLEVNTRLQVEHPVTEETSGMDLVGAMLRISAGASLEEFAFPSARGHAIEFRINAEDPGRGFLPAPGVITRWIPPEGPGVRVDAGVREGSVIDGRFDSLLAKVVITGADRPTALARARRALGEMVVEGVPTLLPFHQAVLRDPRFAGPTADAFRVYTDWVEKEFRAAEVSDRPASTGADEVTVAVLVGRHALTVRLPGLRALGARAGEIRAQAGQVPASAHASRDGAVLAPMQGTIAKVAVTEGEQVEQGALIAVLETMKMENPVLAHRAGTVTNLDVAVGASVKQDQALCILAG
jgi:acetyl-CoA/propionyl-CoA carboxylase, biotin carboxylase, biotin carboxyl carrier protein